MAAIDATTAASAATESAAVKARDRLGQKDFLKLMMTQFSNQDPFKPLDSAAFLGQLAQFSTVSGIQDMQGSLATLVERFKSDQALSGATLVGRTVLTPASTATLGAQGSIEGAVDVPKDVPKVIVAVRDAAGQLVRRFEINPSEGLSDFSWDGITDGGDRAAAGRYTIQALGVFGNTAESLPVLMNDRVSSVTLDPANQSLILNTASQGSVPLSGVRRIG